MKINKFYVFVYGTLKKNYKNHHFLSDSKYIGSGFINGFNIVKIKDKYYPGLVYGNNTIFGEIYLVDKRTLNTLDILEETRQKLYERKKVNVFLKNKKHKINAFYYLLKKRINTKITNLKSF